MKLNIFYRLKRQCEMRLCGHLYIDIFQRKSVIVNAYTRFLDLLVKQGIGKFLFFLVYLLLILTIAVEYLIFFPYESQVRPSYLLHTYFILGIYLMANVNFHYYKACSIDPGRPMKSKLGAQCHKCNNHKPKAAHHCSICDSCILQMDHHCIWINQCVGKNNHRHFLQFIVFVWISELLILYSNYNAFFDFLRDLHKLNESPFCTMAIDWIPWKNWSCVQIPSYLNGFFCFNYGLSVLLSIILCGFCIWNFYLISIGETFIEFMQSSDWKHRRSIVKNWRQFLGVTNRKSFMRYVLLPSSHTSEVDVNLGRIVIEI